MLDHWRERPSGIAATESGTPALLEFIAQKGYTCSTFGW
jgi:hypothetical protein